VCVGRVLKIHDPEKLVFSPVFQKGGGAKKGFPFSFSFVIF
jgi:hypothetical protein